jgi:O-antigen/teichoic acid export membrane protein
VNLKETAVRGIAWSSLQQVSDQATTVVLFLVLARLLGPEAFGLVALASSLVGAIKPFLNQGLSVAIVQRRSLEPEHLDTAFWVILANGLTLTMVGIVLSGAVARLFNQPQLEPILMWLSLGFVVSAFSSVQYAVVRRNLDFKALAIRSMIATLGGATVGILMAFGGFGVWSLVGKQLAQTVLGAVVIWSISDWRPGLRVSLRHGQDLLGFGVSVLGLSILEVFNRHSANLLLGYFLGPAALGYYTIAQRFSRMVRDLLIGTVGKVATPVFSRLQDNPGRLRRAFYSATQLTSLAAFPAFLGLWALAPALVSTILGAQWEASVHVMEALAFLGLVQTLVHLQRQVVISVGKPSWVLASGVGSTAGSNLALLATFKWGITAVAISQVVVGYLFAPISFWFIQRLVGIKLGPYLRGLVAPGAATLVMLGCIVAVQVSFDGQVRLIASVFSGIVMYGAVLSLVFPALVQQVLAPIRRRPHGLDKRTTTDRF